MTILSVFWTGSRRVCHDPGIGFVKVNDEEAW